MYIYVIIYLLPSLIVCGCSGAYLWYIACVYVAIKCHFVILFLSLLCVTVFLSSGRWRWVCYEYAGRFFLVSFCKGETVPIFPHSNTQSTKIIRETEGTVDISRSTVASGGE